MKLQKTYTALLVADLATAETWYTKLLGRGPDFRPMDSWVQWELSDNGGLALSTDKDISGTGVMFIVSRGSRGRTSAAGDSRDCTW